MSVTVRILGDDSDLQSKLKDSRKAISAWASKAALAAGAAGVAITKVTADTSREITNLSRLINQNTTEFQKNAAAARRVGIEQDKYADIMKDVQDKVGDFLQTGAGPMADFFEQIAPQVGVTADQFKKLNGRDALQLYVDSLEKANVSQNEMTFYMEAIASDASLLVPLLEDGGKGFRELGDQAERAGAIMSEVELAQMEVFNQGLSESKDLVKGLTNQIALQLAPVMQGLGDLFGEEVAGGANRMKESVEKAFEFTIKGAGIVGDGIRGIQVIVKGIELAFWGLSAVTIEVFEQISKGIDDYLVKPAASSINALIDGFNKIPGIDIERLVVGDSAVTEKLTQLSDEATAKMKETASELHNLMMEPLPSQALENFVALAQEKSEEAAQAIIKAKNGAGLGVPGLTDEDAENAEENAERIGAAMGRPAASFAHYGATVTRESKQLQDTLTDIEEEGERKRKAISGKAFSDRIGLASSMFGNLATLMDTESRKLFEVGKAAALAQAVVDGIAAAVSSYKAGAAIGGPVLGAAFAATSAVATGVQIASLSSQTFDSASSGGGGGAGGVSVPSTQSADAVAGQAGSAAQGGDRTLFVEGISENQFYPGGNVRQLAADLIEFQKDGGQVVLT